MTPLDTKDRLIEAGERLFAENGIAATSLRDITAAADANLASVNYHFGGKDGLLEAIFVQRLAPVNAERLRLLDAFEADGAGSPSLDQILWAFLSPPFEKMAEAGDGARHFMRIVGRMHSDPVQWGEFFRRQFDSIAERFLVALTQALPELTPPEVVRRMQFLIGSMAHTFCWAEQMCPLGQPEGEWRVTLDSLLQFAAAGMSAPTRPVEVELPAVVSTENQP